MKKIALTILSLFISLLAYGQSENTLKNLKWAELNNNIKSDSIICLGEESHWVETYIEIKNSIVQNIHKEKEFNVLIFESGFVNSFITYIRNFKAKEKLKESLYTIWQTKSGLELIKYIDNSQKSSKPIMQLGCDLKGPISYEFSKYLNELFIELNDREYAAQISDLDSLFINARHKWEPEIGEAFKDKFFSKEEYAFFNTGYSVAKITLTKNKKKIIDNELLTKKEFDFLFRSIQNRLYLIELMQLPTYQMKHKYRDSIMAENINWIIKDFSPNQKYIIWGADIHISKNAKWEEAGEEWLENKSMIEILVEKKGMKLFSIGIKPLKSLKRKNRRMLNRKRNIDYLYLDYNSTDITQFNDEHDALILCKKTEKIKKLDE